MSFLVAVLGALLLQAAPSPSPSSAAGPALTEEAAAALLQKSPAFTGANSARRFARVKKLMHVQEGAQEGWLAEFEWQEADKARVAVAPITWASAPHEGAWYFQHGGWGVVAVAEDRTIDQVVELMKGAKVRAFEAAAVGDTRSVISAEVAYASTTADGSYGELRCLAEPATCTPGSKYTSMLPKELASLADKTGYRRKFHAGPRTKGGFSAFAYTAVPVKPGETGVRGFCGDDTGRICFTSDGSEPPVLNGRCAPPCQELK